MTTIELKTEGMTCGGCVKNIQNELNEQTGASNAIANLYNASVTVDYARALIK